MGSVRKYCAVANKAREAKRVARYGRVSTTDSSDCKKVYSKQVASDI